MPLFEPLNELLRFLPAFLIRIFSAAVCGLIIGIERERRGKAAGYRTIILITVGSCLYTIISQYASSLFGNSDPTRIASQIVTGIGFLGAGTIILSRVTIIGLTTAAVIWAMAAVGMIAGFGLPVFAFIATLFILLMLLLTRNIEQVVLGPCHFSIIEFTFATDATIKETISTILINHEVDMTRYNITEKGGDIVLELKYCDRHIQHHRFLDDLYNLEGIKGIVKRNKDSI